SSDVHRGERAGSAMRATHVLERRASDIEIREGNGDALHDLAGLVTLASDQQRIARLQAANAFIDGGGAVADLAGVGRALADGGANERWVFRARVIVSDDHLVGEAA